METSFSSSKKKLTPMMKQWVDCKEQAKDAILFFRLGDFYEAFYEDAAILSKELELTLTKRQEVPMSGIPWHSASGYIDKLIGKGYRIAIAEQTSDPKDSKGLVEREIVRVISPGSVVDSSFLNEKSNNFFASITRIGSVYGLAFVDFTTGQFQAMECTSEDVLRGELFRLKPSEVLTSEAFQKKQPALFEELKLSFKPLISPVPDWQFQHDVTCPSLLSHFKVKHLDGFGMKGMVAGINAAGALLAYLQTTLSLPTDHISELATYSTSNFMSLDVTTQRNLELTECLHDSSQSNTLLQVLDQTQTSMGGRLLRQWILQPLLDIGKIQKRQDAISDLIQNQKVMKRIAEILEEVRDIERLMTKVSSGYATARDLVSLKSSFIPVPEIKQLLSSFSAEMLLKINAEIDPLEPMIHRIATTVVDEPPIRISDGNVIRDCFHPPLDELRAISRDSKTWLGQYQQGLRDDFGTKTLKVGYNKMFGYYIEVSKAQSKEIPDTFERRQTLVNAERYITPELKEFENKVLNAEERISAIEAKLFNELKQDVLQYNTSALQTARALACLDALYSLAKVALQRGYNRPSVDQSSQLNIIGGCHPVISAAPLTEAFVPNDTELNPEQSQMYLITGPNMAGKSTYIRQVALLTIMAQIGSFLPVDSAQIGIVDKVFTRIGASDDLSRGQSTFMVEMTETANILHHATSRSLVILDEIGRGTSTYDGISIAWAVAEYLLSAEGKKAKTLFATHYWELTKLEEKIPHVTNYNVAVKECGGEVIFLRKIVKGGTDRSYGIHVAKLAGMPSWVTSRAEEILDHLEENASRDTAFDPVRSSKGVPRKAKRTPDPSQLFLFGESK